MSETARSTVKEIEDDRRRGAGSKSGTGTTDNHSPILPDADNASPADDGDVTTLDNHSPIGPEGGSPSSAGDGDVTTLDNHSPIAPPKD